MTAAPQRPPPRPRDQLASLPRYVAGSPAIRPDGTSGYKLSSNECPYPVLPEVTRAIAEAARSANRYPLSGDELRLRLAQHHGLPETAVGVSGGSLELLRDLLLGFTGAGTSVVYGWRSYEAYPILVRTAGAEPIAVPLRDHRVDLERLAAAAKPDTRAVLLADPNNPTGTAVDLDALEQFAQALSPECLLILDQAYCEFADGERAGRGLGLAQRLPNVVVLRTFSKAYALAGMRIGWCAADPEILASLEAVALPFTLTALAQAAALAALDQEEALFAQVQTTVAQRRRVRQELLAMNFEVPPSAANFLWLPLGAGSAGFARWCSRAGISVRCFDGDGVRVTIGTPVENDVFLAAARGYRPNPDRL
ncbi:MAG: histidinol-phosphate transaminase [Candidatus Dormibacteria bacterium]